MVPKGQTYKNWSCRYQFFYGIARRSASNFSSILLHHFVRGLFLFCLFIFSKNSGTIGFLFDFFPKCVALPVSAFFPQHGFEVVLCYSSGDFLYHR